MANKTKWISNPGAPDHTWQAKYKARRDEIAREAAIRREGLQKIVDDATLDKLAELAGIPQEKRGAFYSSVRAAVGELRRGMEVQHPQPRRKPILAAMDEYQAAIGMVRELLTRDGVAPSRAHEYARGDVLTFLCGIRGEATDEAMFDGVALLDDLDRAIEKAKPEIEKAFKAKGRPPGAKNGQKAIDVAIDLFIHQLISSIRKAGGHIATSRTQASSPTYIGNAVEILRPFLPGSFPATERLERKFETIGTKTARRTATPTRK